MARTRAREIPSYSFINYCTYLFTSAQQNYELRAMNYTMTVLHNLFVMDLGHPNEGWRREFDSGKVHSLMNTFRSSHVVDLPSSLFRILIYRLRDD